MSRSLLVQGVSLKEDCSLVGSQCRSNDITLDDAPSVMDLILATTEQVRDQLRNIFKSKIKQLRAQHEEILANAGTNSPAGTGAIGKIAEVVHYSVPVKCFPRVYKSQHLIRNIVDRCSNLENDLGLPRQPTDLYNDLSEIDIYITRNAKLDINSLLIRSNCIEEKGTLVLNVLEKNSAEVFLLRQNFSGIFIDENGVKVVEKISLSQMHVIENTTGKASSVSSGFDPDNIKLELSSLLEHVVFEVLYAKCNTLKDLRTGHQSYKSKLGSVSQHNDAIKQLLGEMIALFNRSTLPKSKHPVILGYEKKQVCKEMETKLFHFDDTIRGCGYRYSTFNVNVECLADEEENMKRKKRITNFLETYGIRDVKFNDVSKSLTEFKRVGARVSTNEIGMPGKYHHGTLGAFARLNKANKTSSCAFFSRHVANGCHAKLYVNDNGKMTELGDIMKETLQEGSYDIAAATIHKQHVPDCDEEFKNSENIALPGKLYTPAGDISLQDLPVHLWGSESQPGFGMITIPELSFPEATETYIQIEDREPFAGQALERMAVEGDSGAIVCADDLDDEHVHVISMLMGSNTDEKKLKDPNVKRTYIAFPVQKGIEHLQSKTDGTFTLKGVMDSE